MLIFRSGIFVVGPESAGANPGPACYGRGIHVHGTHQCVKCSILLKLFLAMCRWSSNCN